MKRQSDNLGYFGAIPITKKVRVDDPSIVSKEDNTISVPTSSTSQVTAGIKVIREKTKRVSIMRFNQSLHVNSKVWKQVRMERENNYKEFKLDNEDNPKYGLGSEFGRENREEARRKKYGIITKKYSPEDQPWILKFGGKGGKKFKGIREGGVTENVSYYIFKRTGVSQYEAHPVVEWYNFTPIQCYKTLSPEEAEEAYGRREKVFNYFSIMTQKRLRADVDVDEDGDEKAPGKKKKKKPASDFKITDFDEVENTFGSDISESEDETNEEKPKKKEAKKGKKKKKKDEDKSDDEALEESDEGDFDDKEVDYMTNSSSSEEEIGEEEKTNRDLKGVEDEEALRKLMSEDEDEENPEENKETEENGENKEKAAEAKTKQKRKKSDSSAESSSESSDSDYDDPKFTSAIFVAKSKKKNGSDNSAGSSRANTPTKQHGDKDGQRGIKRKSGDTPVVAKKQRLENQSGHSSSSTLDGINEETVRRYLQRKPMTAVELLHKFKSKKTKMSSQQLVQRIADVLKRMDLQKSNIKGKMYLSVKSTS